MTNWSRGYYIGKRVSDVHEVQRSTRIIGELDLIRDTENEGEQDVEGVQYMYMGVEKVPEVQGNMENRKCKVQGHMENIKCRKDRKCRRMKNRENKELKGVQGVQDEKGVRAVQVVEREKKEYRKFSTL